MPGSGDIRVMAWPDEPTVLSHGFDAGGQPMPARIAFAGPLGVRLGSGAPIPVSLDLALRAMKSLPLCLSLCERLCATSRYDVAITLFDRPVLAIRVSGTTTFGPEGG